MSNEPHRRIFVVVTGRPPEDTTRNGTEFLYGTLADVPSKGSLRLCIEKQPVLIRCQVIYHRHNCDHPTDLNDRIEGVNVEIAYALFERCTEQVHLTVVQSDLCSINVYQGPLAGLVTIVPHPEAVVDGQFSPPPWVTKWVEMDAAFSTDRIGGFADTLTLRSAPPANTETIPTLFLDRFGGVGWPKKP